MKKVSFVLIILFISSYCSKAQNKDSILKIIPTVKDEKARIKLIYDIIGDSGDNDPEKALYYYKKLLELAHQSNDKVAESIVTAEMGYAIYYIGNTVQGTETILKGCRLADETGNQQAIGIAYDNLSIVYEDPIKRRRILDKALAASTAANDYYFMCFEYGNIANILASQNKQDSAAYYRQRKYDLAMLQKVEQMIPDALIGMGMMYYLRGQKSLALEHCYSALREPYIKKDAKTAVAVYGTLSTYYRLEGKADSALYYALAGYQIAKIAFFKVQLGAIPFVYLAYEKANQSDSALRYMRLYYTMKDSLTGKMKRQQIQTQLMAEEERQLTIDKEHKSNLQYAAIALGVLVLLISFLVFSHSTIANQKLIRFLGILSLLIVFEFLNLLLHPFLEKITHHQPLLMLAIMVGIASLLIPLHHKLEHFITHKMVEKNNRIRLAKAKKTIEELEEKKQAT